MNRDHVMVDIESLDVTPDAVVVSIGATRFNLDEIDSYESLQANGFYTVLDLQQQISKGRSISGRTIQWWMRQSTMAKDVFNAATESVPTGLKEFSDFCYRAEYLWGNGAAFDNVIMRSIYTDFGLAFPFSYSRDMCYRTIRTMFSENDPMIERGVEHNALDDAIYQALCLQYYARQSTQETLL